MRSRARLLALPLFLVAASCPGSTPRPTDFAGTIAALSERGGYFDTDNLISNERSYLHAISDLRAAGVRGGAYIGVGSGQNFSYIAEIEPELAVIIDIRRDNVLQHLIYKALFEAAERRVEFLALLTGRPAPPDPVAWADADLDSIIAWVNGHEPDDASRERSHRVVRDGISTLGLGLAPGDAETIGRFVDEFIDAGLDLRFRSHGRAPQFYYPTLRDLLLEVDREGERVGYLTSAERYRRVRDLQMRDRVLPVVGDLAGEVALRSVATYLRDRGLTVSAFYTSNVEFYLFGNRIFDRFMANLGALPLTGESVIIKSFFRGFRGGHPLQVPGYYSTQLVQRAQGLLEGWSAGSYRSYADIVTRDLVGIEEPVAR